MVPRHTSLPLLQLKAQLHLLCLSCFLHVSSLLPTTWKLHWRSNTTMDKAPTAEAAGTGRYHIPSTKEQRQQSTKHLILSLNSYISKYIIFYDAKNSVIVLHIKLINGFSWIQLCGCLAKMYKPKSNFVLELESQQHWRGLIMKWLPEALSNQHFNNSKSYYCKKLLKCYWNISKWVSRYNSETDNTFETFVQIH